MNGFNWIDIVIFGVLFFYGIQGYSLGFFRAFLDLISFALSFVLALKFYAVLGNSLVDIFSIPQGISYAIGFFVIAFTCEIIFGIIIRRFIILRSSVLNILSRTLGIFTGMFSGFILVSFLLSLIIALPVSSFLKRSVFVSKIGNSLVSKTQGFEKDLNNIFGGAVNETLNFLTIEPEENTVINLHFKTDKFSIDQNAEKEMIVLVNKERVAMGLVDLDVNTKLQDVARKYCMDMIRRGYFSHYTLEGLSPFDRMNKANVYYSSYAGENLALSPNVTIAMQGLMASKGHRANILSPNFGKIGIGVIEAGILGSAFCQEFTD